MSTNDTATAVRILTIEGRGWKEVYEEKDDGSKILIWSNSDKKEDHNEATAMTFTQDMPWSEFCKQYRTNSQYKSC